MEHTKDPSGYEPADVVERLIRCVRDGKYGLDYTIYPTEKNEKLRQKYIVNDKTIKEILLSLTVNEYLGWDYSDNKKYAKEIVYFFHTKKYLIPRYKENANQENISLYIKITWLRKTSYLIVLSIHENKMYD